MNTGQSRTEDDLLYGLGRGTTLPDPQSRIEELLIDLIESGGGSGDASPLTPEQMNSLLNLLN